MSTAYLCHPDFPVSNIIHTEEIPRQSVKPSKSTRSTQKHASKFTGVRCRHVRAWLSTAYLCHPDFPVTYRRNKSTRSTHKHASKVTGVRCRHVRTWLSTVQHMCFSVICCSKAQLAHNNVQYTIDVCQHMLYMCVCQLAAVDIASLSIMLVEAKLSARQILPATCR